ncbi:GTPase Era [Planctomycetes bacterium Pan216]|uniref:GTPase Era n=1 Tax=Kolteria novifilia TaxID=2527975 RepID=A0A518BA49_9BACT|nr:GTPase Era [Planctomycetes bacterium Pan216]
MTTAIDSSLIDKTACVDQLAESLLAWLDQPPLVPPDADNERTLRDSIEDLLARIRHLRSEPSLLTVMFLGGTGVGKSTLLNALAGSNIAEASLARPTTRTPTVYHHRDVAIDRLDPVFKTCHHVTHNRPELRHKVLIDTPDVDGSIKENWDTLGEMLPLADAVVYVGSQEKYHDRFAWELMLKHRSSRGFAFVINKWDRCQLSLNEKTGLAPDKDLRQSLAEAGFGDPLVFRTCASHWSYQRLHPEKDLGRIDDDFLRLEDWVEAGLTDRVIRDIKVRGIVGRLEELLGALGQLIPPSWNEQTNLLRKEWERALLDGLADHASLLTAAADVHSSAFERYFSHVARGNFRGLFRVYLSVIDWLTQLRVPSLSSLRTTEEMRINELVNRCVASIPQATRSNYHQALTSNLLVLADRKGWPVKTLRDFLPKTSSDSLGDAVLADILGEQLQALEKRFTDPTGGRRAQQAVVCGLCDWLPMGIVIILFLKWCYNAVMTGFWDFEDYLGSLLVVVGTLMVLHMLLIRTIPSRWDVLRDELRKMIGTRLVEKVGPIYLSGLEDFHEQLKSERRMVVEVLEDLTRLHDQLERAERPGSQSGMFAHPTEG